ncbi:MAG: hypothetical protein GBAus27B_000119 [Mycoplasmataceae bacterium]|nr:MAG: hypothetical protein GBAus27B_000119 [Mycoplasmataceae bacterium]
MTKFEVNVSYLSKTKKKFFNDKEVRSYHEFLVINPEIMPDEIAFLKEKRDNPCQIWILDDLIKEAKINFGNLSEEDKDYKFIINFEENKSAKFNTNSKNWMVLKTKDYFENTIEKIGFWDSDDYLYESAKERKGSQKETNDIGSENKINWRKISFFCLPIIIFFFFVLLILKLVVKNI